MSDDEKGLYEKYAVYHIGQGEKLADKFVLSPVSDPFARKALEIYAELTPNELLKSDLQKWIRSITFRKDHVALFLLSDIAARLHHSKHDVKEGWTFIAEDNACYEVQKVYRDCEPQLVIATPEKAYRASVNLDKKYRVPFYTFPDQPMFKEKFGVHRGWGFGDVFHAGRPIKITGFSEMPSPGYGVIDECTYSCISIFWVDIYGAHTTRLISQEYAESNITITFLDE